jgi:hypothetical protein
MFGTSQLDFILTARIFCRLEQQIPTAVRVPPSVARPVPYPKPEGAFQARKKVSARRGIVIIPLFSRDVNTFFHFFDYFLYIEKLAHRQVSQQKCLFYEDHTAIN